jgi:hypothetical protein
MAMGNVAPKADQPRATTESIKRGEKPANLEYRTQGVQSFNRSPKTRNMGRAIRG